MGIQKGILVILSGPSGVGKDTLIDRWRQVNPRVERVVAYTTREPRAGEQDGIDYHFVAEGTFTKLAEIGAFLEYKQVHGNFYATPLSDMESMLAEGKIAILKIDVQGAIAAMQLRPDAISIFIEPPSEAELERRILGRAADAPEAIQKRLSNARQEMLLARHYRHRIVNDSVESAVKQLESLVGDA